MMDTLKYIFTRYILKFILAAFMLYLLVMAILRIIGTSGVDSFYDSGWSWLLMISVLIAFANVWSKFPFRTKSETCEIKGHKTIGCKCTRCGMVVDESNHVWNNCKCIYCGKVKEINDPAHNWDGCKCVYCGKIKDINDPSHNWDGCKCSCCGIHKGIDDPQHQWNGCLCTHCGAIRNVDHIWHVISSKHFAGNDINGWGPGGETYVTYECYRCGQCMEDTLYDDDIDNTYEADDDN